MSLKRTIITRSDGETFELRQIENGDWLCPVCAESLRDCAPYAGDGRFGSQDICMRCETQFGHGDHPSGAETLQSNWKRLRFEWLQKSGWKDDDLKRLTEYLGIDTIVLRREAEGYFQMRDTNPAQ
ncbi:MAG: hypothetical protein IT436_12145 [Phycisphaerales bacterium]|nr:hypothetical protein [Phycisphaerales bacterium]